MSTRIIVGDGGGGIGHGPFRPDDWPTQPSEPDEEGFGDGDFEY